MRQYIPFFQTLHDEPGPTGRLGRGTHFSVFRSIVWHDCLGNHLKEAVYHDFALIWDEDHDERVVPVVQSLYATGLLPPILFIGERKAVVSVVLSGDMPESYLGTCKKVVRRVTEEAGDPWELHVSARSFSTTKIIEAASADVELYLKAIAMLWHLGRPKPVI